MAGSSARAVISPSACSKQYLISQANVCLGYGVIKKRNLNGLSGCLCLPHMYMCGVAMGAYALPHMQWIVCACVERWSWKRGNGSIVLVACMCGHNQFQGVPVHYIDSYIYRLHYACFCVVSMEDTRFHLFPLEY